MSHLLTLNAGSSSVKFRLFKLDAQLQLRAGGKVENIGDQDPTFAGFLEGTPIKQSHPLKSGETHEEAIGVILEWLEAQGFDAKDIQIAAHRIVHGGERFTSAVLLDSSILEFLISLTPLAPLHQPHNLNPVTILKKLQPHIIQYGCFDTAFHAHHTPLFHEFALPEHIRTQGVKRYGFHGLSYRWIAHCLEQDFPALFKGKVVVAHLGNGASLCALDQGKSIDTTMGMTALDGLPMGTRCGALDAGAVLYMLQSLRLSPKEIEEILYKKSGLKGLSGLTNDVKMLLGSQSEQAKFALDYFSLKTAQYIAAMAVSMGGIEGLVFTGGIGENAGLVREKICSHLSFLPAFTTHVIPANEERAMALEVWTCLKKTLTIDT